MSSKTKKQRVSEQRKTGPGRKRRRSATLRNTKRLGRSPVQRKERRWKQEIFLDAFRRRGVIMFAAAEAKIDRGTHYKWARRGDGLP